MSIEPELISWLKTLAGSGLTGALIAKAVAKAWKQFVEKPIERAEAREREAKRETEQWKKMWKEEQSAREKRIADAETALLGRPSLRAGRDEQPTLNMVVESVSKRQHEDDLQRRMLAERAKELPAAPALEAFAPRTKPRLHGAGGHQDYDDHRRRQLERGDDTPTAFKPSPLAEPFPYRTNQTTHRDPDED